MGNKCWWWGCGYLDIKEFSQDSELNATAPAALHANPLTVFVDRLPEDSSRVGFWVALNPRGYNLSELSGQGEPVGEDVGERTEKARVVVFHYPQDHGSPAGEGGVGGVRFVGGRGGEGGLFGLWFWFGDL